MDKLWAEPSGAAWDDYQYTDEHKIFGNPIIPQARMGQTWEENGNAWSAAIGAVVGAGTVLVLAAALLLWRRPRKRLLPLLAPMDVGYNTPTKERKLPVRGIIELTN